MSKVTAIGLAACTFLLYVVTLAPTFSWGDSADLPLRVYGEPHAEAEATARDYVLYRSVGRAFLGLPFGDVAYRINLMSATFSTIGVVAVYAMVRRRTASEPAALVAALGLACSHTWWWMSVVSEVYTFAGSLILLALWLWLEWTHRGGRAWLIAAAAMSGLAASAHLAGALLLLPIAFYLYQCRAVLRRSDWALVAAAILAGSGFSIAMAYQALVRTGLAGLRDAVDPTNPGLGASLWRQAGRAAVLLLYQYPVLGSILGVIGGFQMLKGKDAWDRLALWSWALLLASAGLSRIPDLFNAYALSFVLLAPMLGVGAAFVLRQPACGRAAATLKPLAGITAIVVLPLATYSIVPAAADYLGRDATGARVCPERNNNWYFLFPPKRGDYGPRRFAERALDAAGPNGVILADYTLWRPLKYLQLVEGRRPDVVLQIIDPLLGGDALTTFVTERLADGHVYVAAIEPPGYYDLPQLRASFAIAPADPIYELRGRP